MQTGTYSRKPFFVEAVQVDDVNLLEVTEWCGGVVQTVDDKSFIKVRVHRPINERQSQAHVGDWVIKASRGFKVYTNKAFLENFNPVEVASIPDQPFHSPETATV